MPYRTDVIYRYDGSFAGLLTCVFESFYRKEMPYAILPPERRQEMLYQKRHILTEKGKADRVFCSVREKISGDALYFVTRTFLTCLEDKEELILRFLHKGYRIGPKVMHMLTDHTVARMMAAVSHLEKEAHLFTGFVRFSEYRGVLVAVIEPKNYVLPLLAPHFCDRLREEAFLLFDKTHKEVLLYRRGQREIVPMEEIVLPAASEKEVYYRTLWKLFYDTIAIESRYNPKGRQTHMPKRYWANMTEFLSPDVEADGAKCIQPRFPG